MYVRKPEIIQCESCSSMKASIQNLIQEFKAAVFENDESDFRNVSELKVFFATSGLSEFQFRF